MTLCDAHLHLAQCQRVMKTAAFEAADNAKTGAGAYYACTCAHDEAEFAEQQRLIAALTAGQGSAAPLPASAPPQTRALVRVVSAFGIHPQNPDLSRAAFLEQLLQCGAIGAIGEAGFDMFTPAFAAQIDAQEEAWRLQLELSERYGVPLIVHCRKAQERLFRDRSLLRKLPAVVFHSFMGSVQDAASLMRRGVNAYFSFGKPLLSGKKSAIDCVRRLAPDRLLLETDAPYQTLKGESATHPREIMRVYAAAAALRGCSMEQLSAVLSQNFARVFGW